MTSQTVEKETVKEILEKQIKAEHSSKMDTPHPPLTYKEGKVSVVSLFSGAGGLDLGVEWAGMETGIGHSIDFNNEKVFQEHKEKNIFHTVYALDNAAEALSSYSKHFKDTVAQKLDIRKLAKFPYADLYTFGFPCPGFSAAGPRLIDDKRNFLYIHCCRALLEAQPKIFVAENVPGMLSLGGGKVFKQIKEDFEATGYKVYTHLLNAEDYGVPQLRSRVILVGVRHDLDFVYEEPTKTHGEGLLPYVTLRDAIKDLEFNTDLVYEGTYSSRYMGRNRKKHWSDCSFTIQASGRHAPLHPGGNPMIKVGKEQWAFADGPGNERRISAKEAARIQTFPDWYWFDSGSDDVSHNTKVDKVFKQIGNAVPVKMAKHIIKPIADYLYRTQEDTLSLVTVVEEPLAATCEEYFPPIDKPVQLSIFDFI
ncbi:DNA (cytosine-5-)-methyltransferase [[Brevibacterium] frigoritolerans]|nr:DNA (cytosine-5-)-methyltransferase [Peribacillus frigoritolerans]